VGDANGDGQFDSTDLVLIFQAGEYEDAIAGNSTWSEGDWTCDGDFDTSDLVAAFQSGNYELTAAAIAVRTDSRIALDETFNGQGRAIPFTAPTRQARLSRGNLELLRPLATDEVMTDRESWFPLDED
jgi:hypothetical protein